MSAQAKQIQWYSVGVSQGERPRSAPSIGIGGGIAHVNVAANSGSVSIGTEITQAALGHVNVAGIGSTITIGSAISQDTVAHVNVAGISAGVTLGQVYAASGPAHVNVAANSGTIRVGLEIGARIGHVNVAAGLGQITLQAAFIVQDEPAHVNVAGILSSVTIPPVGGQEITQTAPAYVNVAGNVGAVSGQPNQIVQHTPAWVAVTSEPGAVSLLVTQSDIAHVNAAGISADIILQGNIAARPGSITVAANNSVVVVGNVISPDTTNINIAAGKGAVRVGLQFGTRPGYVTVAAGSGSIAVGYEIVQNAPAYVTVAGNFGDVSLEAALPQTITQDEAAHVNIAAGLGALGIGGPAFCRWFAPPDCLDDSTIARKIMYKQPAEEIWLAYNFKNRLLDGEMITNVLELDDGGAGIIGSPGIIQSYSTPDDEVKYLTVNGTDLTNVRIQHRVQTSDGRTLEGDGFLYVRGEL